jgi:hypothetical protein
MIAHDELLNKLLPQLKKWLAAEKGMSPCSILLLHDGHASH